MAYETFVDKNFRRASLEIIEHARRITVAYKAKGFTLTLRQLYYQFVARGLLPNTQANYKRLGSIVNDARLAGLLDWSTIEDRGRNLESPNTWKHPTDILGAVASQYQENPWLEQEYWPEVWIEKDALVGVIEPTCDEWRVPYIACRGYMSQSEMYAAGKRLKAQANRGRIPIVFHLGDHDPSGIHMTQDIRERLELFADGPIEVRRLALNMDQVDQYNPPPNPAKDTDTRFDDYVLRFGEECWELDALDPEVIADLVKDAVTGVLDKDRWYEVIDREDQRKATLEAISDQYEDVAEYVRGLD